MMKRRIFKRLAVCVTLAAALSLIPALGGCRIKSGRDGINGKDLTIFDIWQETIEQTNNPDLTFEEFLRDFLSYNSDELGEATSIKNAINRSLLSSVSIVTAFTEYTHTGFGSSYATDVTYCGSGVIVDINKSNGDMTVVTNCHVVYSADARTSSVGGSAISPANGFAKGVYMWFYGADYPETDAAMKAQIVAASKSYDIAVLKVSGSDMVKNSMAKAVKWSSDEEITVGETVFAVGNADGKDMAASVGYISKDSEEIAVELDSKGSEIYSYRVLRTDAAINGGNSGGGLFNKYGEVVGIINAKSVSENVDNMGYALCASTTRRVVQKLIDEASGSKFGLSVFNPNFIFTVSDKYTTGLDKNGNARIKEVITVASNGNGLRYDDVIKSVKVTRDGKIIESISVERRHNLTDIFLSVKPGDSLTFTVERNGANTEVTASIGANNMKSIL